MKKKILALVLALAMVLGLAACGSSGSGSGSGSQSGSQTSNSDFKVGAIYINKKSDTAGYTYAHHTGITKAMKELGMDPEKQLVIVDQVPEDDTQVGAAVDTLVGEGCSIIFGISFGYLNEMEVKAQEYPDVIFSHATGFKSNDTNYNNYFGRIYQARYLAGIAAGLKTESNVLGYVAAKPYAEVISGYTAFYLGAKSVNPDVTMLVNYTNEWSDATKEATNAQALIDQGCDVISQHSDTSAPATTAETNGVFAVGYNDDMISVAPNAALVSARINWGAYYEYALNCLLAGEAIDQDWCGSYAEGACYLSDLNEAIIADGTKEAIEAAAAGIADGSIQVFAGPLYGVNADGEELNLAEGEFYPENETSSAPSFAYIVDGITVLS